MRASSRPDVAERSQHPTAPLAIAALERRLLALTPAEPIAGSGSGDRRGATRTTPRSDTRRTSASGGTRVPRDPSSPGSRANPGRRARVVGTRLRALSASAAPPPSARGSARCSCRPRQRRARRRTPARPAPCTARSRAGRAARRGRRADDRRVDRDHLRRCRVQVLGPPRVSEPLPQSQHVAERRVGTLGRRRERIEERLPLRDHPLDLCLLQHHLGDEDRPRVARHAPRKLAHPRDPPGQHRRRGRSRRLSVVSQTSTPS